MTKHHWRQQIKSFFESHADPEKHERLKQMKSDMEEKKDKIIKLIKSEQQDGTDGKTESLEELIKDHHKQYESLYEDHLNLTGELHKTISNKNNKDVKEKSSNSSSDSDSDSEKNSSSEKRIIELEELVAKKENENAELRREVVDLELNLRSEERKVAELSRGDQSNDHLVLELQTAIEDLKRDIEMDKDELTTIEEKNRNLEVMLRLSNQKKRVTEQLLSEKEASHVALEKTLEDYSEMIRNVSEQLNKSLGEFECLVNNQFGKDYGGLVEFVGKLTKDVESVKRWVKVSRSANDVARVGAELEATRMKVEKLEKEKEKAVKEKDEMIMSLEEEKREAIRQLCVWSEDYRSRYAELRGVMVKNNAVLN